MASLKGADKLRAQLVQEAAQKAGGIGAAVVKVTMADCGNADADEDDWHVTGGSLLLLVLHSNANTTSCWCLLHRLIV
jgi:hypothetical protein